MMESKFGRTRAKSSGWILGVLGVVSSIALGGCADMSFKPGATPGDMQRDELACRESAADDDAYASCMKANGYLISKAGDGIDWTPATR